MTANTRTVSSVLTIIEDPLEVQAALDGNLKVEGKPVLVCRGGDTARTVAAIYRSLAASKDWSGSAFKLSSRNKGLVHRDKFNGIGKVTAYEFEKYVERDFCLCEVLTSADGTCLHLSKNKPVLAIMKKCPRFSGVLWQQRRWLQDSELSMFQWSDV
jgi:hypothetical protein